MQHLPEGHLALGGDVLHHGVLPLPGQGVVQHLVDAAVTLQSGASVACTVCVSV